MEKETKRESVDLVNNQVVNNVEEDVVNEPQHYQHGSFEVIDEMIIAFGPAATIQFCVMNAWKYRSRAPFKGKMEQDMAKANRYMEYAHQIQVANSEQCFGTPVLIKGE